MPDEIRAGFYPAFEQGWRRIQLAGRAVMLLAVAAALAGLLGGGQAGLWTRKAGAGALQVEYQPTLRIGTPANLTLLAQAPPGQDRVAVSLAADITRRYGLESVVPQPVEWQSGEGGAIRMVFLVQPGAPGVVVHLGGRAAGGGMLRLQARLDGGPAAAWSQLVLP